MTYAFEGFAPFADIGEIGRVVDVPLRVPKGQIGMPC